MLNRRGVMGGALTAGLFASPLAGAVRFGSDRASAFTIAHGGAVVAAHAVDGNFDCHLAGRTAGYDRPAAAYSR